MDNLDLTITKDEIPDETGADKTVRFHVSGRIYYYTSPSLQKALDDAFDGGMINIIVNMSEVEYLCSSGIKALLKTHKDAVKAGGSLSVEQPSEHVRSVLKMTALDDILIR